MSLDNGSREGAQVADSSASAEARFHVVSTVEPSQLHRPTCPIALANEARRLAAQGLTPHDLAHVLRLTAPAVAELLKEAA